MNASPQVSWQNRKPHQQQHPSYQHQKIPIRPTTIAVQQANKHSISSTHWSAPKQTNWHQQQQHRAHRQVSLGYSSSTGGSQVSECHASITGHPIGASGDCSPRAAPSRPTSAATYLRMRAPNSQLYGPDSALLAAGGHRMALKLASTAAGRSRCWPQHQLNAGTYGAPSTNGTTVGECRAPDCCGPGDCSSDMVELLSDCSCSDSQDFQCPAYHHQYSMHHQSAQHHQHLSSRRPASDQLHGHHGHQSLKLSSSEADHRYPSAAGYSAGGGQSCSPTPPPPPPPPPAQQHQQQSLLVNQNTYTTTHDTMTDSSVMLAGHLDGLRQQAGSQLHHQRRSNSIETDPLLDEPSPQHHKRAIGQTMSLGRANHLHHPHHHPLPADFMHKPVLLSKSPNKRQQHSVSFRRSAPNPAEPGFQQQQQHQQPLDKLSAVQHHPPQWTPNHLQHQQQANLASARQLDYSRQVNHSHKLAIESATGGPQKKPETRHRNNNQMEQAPAINQCTNEVSPVSLGQPSAEAREAPASGQQQQQQQQASSIAIYQHGSPLGGPTSPAQDLQSQHHQPPLQAPIMGTALAGGGRTSTAHLLSGSGGPDIGGQPVLQLQPATTSHRNYAHWMRVSSIVLTPVGLIIILFIVVSPLLHYLM